MTTSESTNDAIQRQLRVLMEQVEMLTARDEEQQQQLAALMAKDNEHDKRISEHDMEILALKVSEQAQVHW